MTRTLALQATPPLVLLTVALCMTAAWPLSLACTTAPWRGSLRSRGQHACRALRCLRLAPHRP